MNMLTLLLENQITTSSYSDIDYASIKTAGQIPIYSIHCLQKKMKNIESWSHKHSPVTYLMALAPILYHDALQAHMHPLHILGNANTVAN